VQLGAGKPVFFGFSYKLNVRIAGALSMLIIHSPDYVFTGPGKYIHK